MGHSQIRFPIFFPLRFESNFLGKYNSAEVWWAFSALTSKNGVLKYKENYFDSQGLFEYDEITNAQRDSRYIRRPFFTQITTSTKLRVWFFTPMWQKLEWLTFHFMVDISCDSEDKVWISDPKTLHFLEVSVEVAAPIFENLWPFFSIMQSCDFGRSKRTEN